MPQGPRQCGPWSPLLSKGYGMRRLPILIALACLAWATAASAQQPACVGSRINAKGTAGAGITVDATAGGIVVADANTARCHLWIINETANPMRCAPSTGKYALTVSSTVGFLWPANTGPFPVPGAYAQDEWKCIRTGGSSATVSVMEALP